MRARLGNVLIGSAASSPCFTLPWACGYGPSTAANAGVLIVYMLVGGIAWVAGGPAGMCCQESDFPSSPVPLTLTACMSCMTRTATHGRFFEITPCVWVKVIKIIQVMHVDPGSNSEQMGVLSAYWAGGNQWRRDWATFFIGSAAVRPWQFLRSLTGLVLMKALARRLARFCLASLSWLRRPSRG